MDIDFKKIINDCEEPELDYEDFRSLMNRIYDYVRTIIKNTEGEITPEEAIKEFIDTYREENKPESNAKEDYLSYMQYKALKRLTELKNKPNEFNKLLSKAKEKEMENNTERLTTKQDLEEEMVGNLRVVLRNKNTSLSNLDIQKIIEYNKINFGKKVKEMFINSISKSVSYLNDFGFIDDFIETYNNNINKYGLKSIELLKRNPIADSEYENEKTDKPKEDVGVLDSFSEDNLKKLSPETLGLLDFYWKSRYYSAIELMNIAMQIIEKKGLWKDIADGNKGAINNVDDKEIKNIVTQTLINRMVEVNKIEITPDMENEYKEFLKSKNLKISTLEDDVKNSKDDMDNVELIRKQVSMLETINIIKLLQNDLNVKKYGMFEDEHSKSKMLAVDVPELRGTLLIDISEQDLMDFKEITRYSKKLPKFEGIDKDVETASQICIPKTDTYVKNLKKEHENNPSSLTSFLLGKKVKNIDTKIDTNLEER